MGLPKKQKPLIDVIAGGLLDQNNGFSGSSPAPGTLEKLVKQAVSNSATASTDTGRTLNYRPPKLSDAGGDQGQQWHVYYSYRNPVTRKMQRFKIYYDLNRQETKQDRIAYAKAIINTYNDLLRAGYTPFEAYFDPENQDIDRNIISCIDFFLREKKKSVKNKTYTGYKLKLWHFRRWLHKSGNSMLRIDQVKKAHITTFLSKESKRLNWKGKTRNGVKSDLATFFSYFMKNYDDIVVKSPVTGLDDVPENLQGNTAFTDQQIKDLKALMEKKNPYLLFFCEFVYETCTRPQAEARLVQVGDINFPRGHLKVWSDRAKMNVSRYVPLSDRFLNRIKEYIKDFPQDYYVFSRHREPGPKPMNEETIQGWFRPIRDELKLNPDRYTLYGFKHTKNIHAYLQTKDLYFIKELNGHGSLEATAKYLRDLGLFVDLNKIANNITSAF